jgi:acetyl-CoA acetyltransferase
LEELGLLAPGEGVFAVRKGRLSVGGDLPTNPSGGLVCKGHPVGATGVAQVVEVADQLRSRAGGRQVEGARIGITENAGGWLGGDVAAATVHILGR